MSIESLTNATSLLSSGLGVNSSEVGRFIPVTCLGPLLTVTWLRLCALEVKVY